ncbi:MAG: DUF4382 domain-containing protein [Chloroflexi bacterium]|nr:DUF4382 domain-containing protein [Chloroflexota bacterium]
MTEEYNDSDLEKMLKDIYKPETASPQFKERLRRQLVEAASRPAPRPLWFRPMVWAPVAAAVALGLIAYFAVASLTSTHTVRSGSLAVWVTDAPGEVQTLDVTVSEIQVHRAGDDSASDDGWITVISQPVTFDLIALRDVQELLGEEELDPGHYTQVRLIVDNVTVNDEIEAEIKLPSGELKVVGQFEIKADCTTALTLDFDAEASLQYTGEGKAVFQPVVKPIIGEPCQEATTPD